jgi:nitrate reductase NapE component
MLAYSAFQCIWVVLLVGMVGIAGLFAVYMVAQLFRNPGRR